MQLNRPELLILTAAMGKPLTDAKGEAMQMVIFLRGFYACAAALIILFCTLALAASMPL